MVKQQLKNLYFSCNRILTFPNYYLNRVRSAVTKPEYLNLHLGSGDKYRPGFINIEGNITRKKDMWLDLRNPLPFATNSVDFILCVHTLEHLYPDEAINLLKEVYRVLKPNKSARFAVPSFDYALSVTRGEHLSVYPQKFTDPIAQAINYLFCDGQHKYAYNFHIFQAFASKAGFVKIYEYSKDFGIAAKTYGNVTVTEDNAPDSLVVELTK
jgi:predicted SAM-dependent methyltransferase